MAAIISEKFRIFNAKQFLESLSEASATNMYFFVGRPQKWYAYLEIYNVSGTFQVGETVTGGTTSHSSAISAISSDTTTTWLSKNAINAILYGSLVEAYIFMKGEPDVIQQYEKRFMEEVSRLKDFGESRENNDAYRQGLPRRQRT